MGVPMEDQHPTAPPPRYRELATRGGSLVPSSAAAERTALFEHFVEVHSRELGRLAYLMVGDRDAADDLLGDAFLVTWRQWDAVRAAAYPVAYVRRVIVNLASREIRRAVRERRRLVLFHSDTSAFTEGADAAAVVDVRYALAELPARRRACVVLRYAFDLGEEEVARLLGVSVGTVKSQTSKGVEQLRRTLAAAPPIPVPLPPAPTILAFDSPPPVVPPRAVAEPADLDDSSRGDTHD